MKLFVLGTC